MWLRSHTSGHLSGVQQTTSNLSKAGRIPTYAPFHWEDDGVRDGFGRMTLAFCYRWRKQYDMWYGLMLCIALHYQGSPRWWELLRWQWPEHFLRPDHVHVNAHLPIIPMLWHCRSCRQRVRSVVWSMKERTGGKEFVYITAFTHVSAVLHIVWGEGYVGSSVTWDEWRRGTSTFHQRWPVLDLGRITEVSIM